jgi:hypothetical protein
VIPALIIQVENETKDGKQITQWMSGLSDADLRRYIRQLHRIQEGLLGAPEEGLPDGSAVPPPAGT